MAQQRAEMLDVIRQQAGALDWPDPALIAGIAWQETRFDPTLQGDGGNSIGLCQIQLATAAQVLGRAVSKDELLEPGLNVRACIEYAKRNLAAARRRADLAPDVARRVVAHAHNAGPGYVLAALAALGGSPSWPAIVEQMQTVRIPIAGREGTWEPAASSYEYVDRVLGMADTFGLPATGGGSGGGSKGSKIVLSSWLLVIGLGVVLVGAAIAATRRD